MKKVLSVLGDILLAVVMIVAVAITVMVIISSKNEDRIPSLFGYSLLAVQSDSMESEKGFYTGDLIVVRSLTDDEANNLKVGDVITFRRSFEDQLFLETHRIIEDTFTDKQHEVVNGVWVHGGVHYYATMGDNTVGVDRQADGTVEYASYGNIVGLWTGKAIPKVGKAMDFIRSSTGFMVCIVIPVALFFIYELYIFIMTLTRRQKERALEEVADKEAELKAKAVAEFLAQQQENAGGTTPPAENTAPAAPPADAPAPAPQDAPTSETPAEPAKPADTSDVSEEEKQRIIQEYLAKQQNKDE